MAVLLLAEHDNKTLAPATAKALDAAAKFGGEVDILVAGENAQGVAEEAAKLAGVRKVLLAECAAAQRAPRRRDGQSDRAADAELRRAARAGHHHGQERCSARGGAARRGANLRHYRGEVAGHLRAPGLCRKRARDGQDRRQEDRRHRPHHGLRLGRRGRGRFDRDHRGAGGAWLVELREERDQRERTAGAHRRAHRRLRRARHAIRRKLQDA